MILALLTVVFLIVNLALVLDVLRMRRRRTATERYIKSLAHSLPYARLTLASWRASDERTAYAASLLAQPLFRDLVGMLANVRPALTTAPDATTAALLLGQRLGHDQIIATLLEAAVPLSQPPSALEADYAPENVMRQWEGEREE